MHEVTLSIPRGECSGTTVLDHVHIKMHGEMETRLQFYTRNNRANPLRDECTKNFFHAKLYICSPKLYIVCNIELGTVLLISLHPIRLPQ